MKKIYIYIFVSIILYGFIMGEEELVFENFSNEFNIDERVEETKYNFENPYEKTYSFSGELVLESDYYSYSGTNYKDKVFSQIYTNLNLEGRFKKNSKIYTSVKVQDTSDSSKDDLVGINEMFLDFNLYNKIYFRFGKQVLAWGTGYFFSPSDLINVDKKTIEDMEKTKGNLGLKIHIPKGTDKNFYSYIKVEDKEKISDIDLALKYEFLINKTEYSLGFLNLGEEEKQIFSTDFSSSFKGAMTFGELTLENGKKVPYYKNGVLGNLGNKPVLKLSLGYSRVFDDISTNKDKNIQLIQEIYYNGAGYSKSEKNGIPLNVYNPYSQGKWYLATFITFSEFLGDKTTLIFNVLSGFTDNAHQLNLTYNYDFTNRLTLGTFITGYISNGSKEGEFYYPNGIIGIKGKYEF